MADIFEKSRDNLRSKMSNFIEDPIVSLMIKLKISPNFVTVSGFALILISVLLISQGMFRSAGLFIFASGFLDIFDGALARKTGLENSKGAFLDSVLDRLSESLVLLGIIYFFSLGDGNIWIVMLASLSLVFSIMISYLRARIEGLGLNSKGGIFTRPERVFVVCVGLTFFTPLVTMIVLTTGVLIGFVHRFIIFWNLLREE